MALLSYAAIGAVALAMTLALGYVVLAASTRLTARECLALGLAAGVALQAAIALLGFFLHAFDRTFMLGAWLLVAVICALIVLRRRRPMRLSGVGWLVLAGALWLALLCAQLVIPVYRGGFWFGDWWMHFDLAQFYLGLRDLSTEYFGVYTVPSRTPLFNLSEAFFLAVFGQDFAIYQVTALVPSLAFLGPFLLLARTERIGAALFVVACSPYLTNNLLFPWPKLLAAAYVLAALYFYLAWRRSVDRPGPGYAAMWGIASGLGIMAHASTALYTLAMTLDLAAQLLLRRAWRGTTVAALGIASAALVAFPWVAWVGSAYGLKALLASTPTVALGDAGLASGQWWIDRFWNAAGTLVPLALWHTLQASRLPVFPGWFGPDLWDPLLNNYFSVLPGALTIAGSLFLLWRLRDPTVRQQALAADRRLYWLLAACGFLGGILLQPGLESLEGAQLGLAAESMAPLVLLALIVLLQGLARIPPAWRRFVACAIVGEFVLSQLVHLAVQALDVLNVGDPNLSLKQEQGLMFARDLIGPAWPAAALAGLTALVGLVWLGFKDLTGRPGGGEHAGRDQRAGAVPGARVPALAWAGLGCVFLLAAGLLYGPVIARWPACLSGAGQLCVPATAAQAAFVAGPSLRGYDLPSPVVRRGGTLRLNLYWESPPGINRTLQSFVHIRSNARGWPLNPGTGNDIWAQEDHLLDGQAMAENPQPDRLTLSQYRVPLPLDMPPGQYLLEVGWFDPQADQQLDLDPATVSPPLSVLWRSLQLATIDVR